MTKYYFSIDVETTSTNPFTGQLLSVGGVAINSETLEVESEFYQRVEYNQFKDIDPETLKWWESDAVPAEARKEAWSKDLHRLPTFDAAKELMAWVNSYGNEWSDRVFCANPVSFDFPWIQKLYAEADLSIPFHYRTLCMRSMYFGILGGEWGGSRDSTGEWHKPDVPHHALSDAKAQGQDLIKMINMKERVECDGRRV